MLKYTIKRLITFIPMLIAISLLSFVITLNSPGDPLENQVKADNSGSVQENNDYSKKHKEKKVKELGLDLPPFYLSIGDLATSKDLYKIYDKDERSNLQRLIHEYGNWDVIDTYYNNLISLKENNNDIKYDSYKVNVTSESTHAVMIFDLSSDQIKIREAINTAFLSPIVISLNLTLGVTITDSNNLSITNPLRIKF